MTLYADGFRVACMISAMIMFFTGVIGNTLIIWTISRVKRMRTLQNMLVAILAVVDLLISGYLLPFSMHVLVTNAKPHREQCRFQSIITAFLFSCSIQFIMFIALSRYLKICHTKMYNRLLSVRNIIIASVFVCFAAACFASPLWFYEFLWTFEEPMHACIFDRYGSVSYSVTFMVIILAIPSLVTAVSYILIYRHISKARRQLYKSWNNGLAKRKLIIEQAATKTQFVVFIMYMVLYFPFFITAVGGDRRDYPDAMHTLAIHFCYLNSCINCILYGFFNKNMRRGYYEALPCITAAQANRVVPTVSGKSTQTTRQV